MRRGWREKNARQPVCGGGGGGRRVSSPTVCYQRGSSEDRWLCGVHTYGGLQHVHILLTLVQSCHDLQ